MTWRMDKQWERMRKEVPHLKRPPSEYVREHFWFATQPIEEPENPQHLSEVIDWIGWDKLVFSSDYPHWDFDDPRYTFKINLTERQRADDLPRKRTGAVRIAMSRHVVATTGEIAPGAKKLVTVKGREIGIFNVDGEYFALANRCPHAGGPMCEGRVAGLVRSSGPGNYNSRARASSCVARGTAGSSKSAPDSHIAIRTT